MAKRTTIVTDVALPEAAGNEGVSGSTGPSAYRRHSNLEAARRARQRARRVEALSLKLAGVSTAQIAQRMGIAPDSVRHLINRTLATAVNRAAEEMRELKNARLDRAQAAIWSQRAGWGLPGRDGLPADQPAAGQTERAGRTRPDPSHVRCAGGDGAGAGRAAGADCQPEAPAADAGAHEGSAAATATVTVIRQPRVSLGLPARPRGR
jgi:DNA-binding CsgD family transcriptional regulator